ncbi:translation initiation factor IF-2-like [Phodopus roborovskii]|uniref:translation initiation factor IF-2-like n=1 Tax=Phodopus roborovskii TaxID=109678 RepID=UPI0021E4E925|nr:translation initiation factor IF-2-like [Phodopus roborovskii]
MLASAITGSGGGKVPPLRPPAQVSRAQPGAPGGQQRPGEGPCWTVAGRTARPRTRPPSVPTGRTRSRWPAWAAARRQADSAAQQCCGTGTACPAAPAAELGPPPPAADPRPRGPGGRKHPGAAPSTWAARAGAASGAARSPSPAAFPPPGAARGPPVGDSAPRGAAGAALPGARRPRARRASPRGGLEAGTVPGGCAEDALRGSHSARALGCAAWIALASREWASEEKARAGLSIQTENNLLKQQQQTILKTF